MEVKKVGHATTRGGGERLRRKGCGICEEKE